MLAAVKNNTVTLLQQQIVSVKRMELRYWQGTFKALSTQASLLTGFAFGSLQGAKGHDNETMVVVYLISVSVCMGFGLLCMSTATFCMIFGMERSLMGTEALESMDVAIESLKNKSH